MVPDNAAGIYLKAPSAGLNIFPNILQDSLGVALGMNWGDTLNDEEIQNNQIGKAGTSVFGIGKYFVPYVGQVALGSDIAGVLGDATEVGLGKAIENAGDGLMESANFTAPNIDGVERASRVVNALLLGLGVSHGAIDAWKTGDHLLASKELAGKLGISQVKAFKLLRVGEAHAIANIEALRRANKAPTSGLNLAHRTFSSLDRDAALWDAPSRRNASSEVDGSRTSHSDRVSREGQQGSDPLHAVGSGKGRDTLADALRRIHADIVDGNLESAHQSAMNEFGLGPQDAAALVKSLLDRGFGSLDELRWPGEEPIVRGNGPSPEISPPETEGRDPELSKGDEALPNREGLSIDGGAKEREGSSPWSQIPLRNLILAIHKLGKIAGGGFSGEAASLVLESLRKEVASRSSGGKGSGDLTSGSRIIPTDGPRGGDGAAPAAGGPDSVSLPRADQLALPSGESMSVGDLTDGALASRVRGLDHLESSGYHSDPDVAAKMASEHGLMKAEMDRRTGGEVSSDVARDAAVARDALSQPGTTPGVFGHVLTLAKEAVSRGLSFAKFAVETGRAFGRKVGQHLRSAWDSAMHWWHRSVDDRIQGEARPAALRQHINLDDTGIPANQSTTQLPLSPIYVHPELTHGTSLADCIAHIRNLPVEVGAIYYGDYWMEEARVGERSQVVINSVKLKGGWFAHNHPDGGTFSLADLRLLLNEEMEGMIAVTPDGIYRIEKPRGTRWSDEAFRMANDAALEAIYGRAHIAVNDLLSMDELHSGGPPLSQENRLALEIKYMDDILLPELETMGLKVSYEKR